jgi:hypothetical protein
MGPMEERKALERSPGTSGRRFDLVPLSENDYDLRSPARNGGLSPSFYGCRQDSATSACRLFSFFGFGFDH